MMQLIWMRSWDGENLFAIKTKGTYVLSRSTFSEKFSNFFFGFFFRNLYPASWGVHLSKNFSIPAPLGLDTGLRKFSKKIFFRKKYVFTGFPSR